MDNNIITETLSISNNINNSITISNNINNITIQDKDAKNITFTANLFKARNKWRNDCIKKLNSVKECNTMKLLTNLKILKKDTQSDSILISGELKADSNENINNSIIIKAFFDNMDPLENSLQVEQQIYINIITNLLNNNHTPCLIDYLGHYDCDVEPFSSEINDEEKKKFIYEVDKMDPNVYDTEYINLLFLVFSPGIVLKKWIDDQKSIGDIVSVLYQLFYTLWCFKLIMLRHNDLHSGNIFIEQFDEPIILYFPTSSGKFVKLKTRYLCKIYDFDRSAVYHPAVERNMGIDGATCETYGQCNMFTDEMDSFTILSILHFHFGDDLASSVKDEFKLKLLKKVVDWKWYIKILTDNQENFYWLLRPNDIPSDEQLKPVEYILNTILEADWSVKPFEIIDNIDKNIPEEIIFTLPPKKKIYVSKPISTKSYPALDSVQLENLSNTTFQIFKIYQNLSTIWFNESDILLKIINLHISTESYYKEIIEKKNIKDLAGMYKNAFKILSYPMFHKLTEYMKEYLFTPEFLMIIGDIWNFYGNIFPVEIPQL